VILIDTSAWIEFLRDTGSSICDEVDRLLGSDIAICDPVRMEVLAGARDEAHLSQLRGLLARATLLPTGPADYESAAALYRLCRRRGATVRKLVDCLIGAVAAREATALLHSDADFDVLARHSDVRIHTPGL
jgi:predicted nucleic acid-binding protein